MKIVIKWSDKNTLTFIATFKFTRIVENKILDIIKPKVATK